MIVSPESKANIVYSVLKFCYIKFINLFFMQSAFWILLEISPYLDLIKIFPCIFLLLIT